MNMRKLYPIFFVLLLFLRCNSAFAVIAHAQTFKAVGSGTSLALGAHTYTAGNMIVCGADSFRSAGGSAISSITSAGDTLTGPDKALTNGNFRVEIWSKYNIAGGSQNYTVSYGATSQDGITFFCSEFSGMGTTKTVDGAGASASGSSSSPASGSFSTTGSNALLIGLHSNGSDRNPETINTGSGWSVDATNGKETNGAANLCGGMEYQLNKTGASYNGDWSLGASFSWTAVAIGFDDAGGGASFKPYSLPITGVGQRE